jgi:hypothetical protein
MSIESGVCFHCKDGDTVLESPDVVAPDAETIARLAAASGSTAQPSAIEKVGGDEDTQIEQAREGTAASLPDGLGAGSLGGDAAEVQGSTADAEDGTGPVAKAKAKRSSKAKAKCTAKAAAKSSVKAAAKKKAKARALAADSAEPGAEVATPADCGPSKAAAAADRVQKAASKGKSRAKKKLKEASATEAPVAANTGQPGEEEATSTADAQKSNATGDALGVPAIAGVVAAPKSAEAPSGRPIDESMYAGLVPCVSCKAMTRYTACRVMSKSSGTWRCNSCHSKVPLHTHMCGISGWHMGFAEHRIQLQIADNRSRIFACVMHHAESIGHLRFFVVGSI